MVYDPIVYGFRDCDRDAIPENSPLGKSGITLADAFSLEYSEMKHGREMAVERRTACVPNPAKDGNLLK